MVKSWAVSSPAMPHAIEPPVKPLDLGVRDVALCSVVQQIAQLKPISSEVVILPEDHLSIVPVLGVLEAV
jgi:hypothetical protein